MNITLYSLFVSISGLIPFTSGAVYFDFDRGELVQGNNNVEINESNASEDSGSYITFNEQSGKGDYVTGSDVPPQVGTKEEGLMIEEPETDTINGPSPLIQEEEVVVVEEEEEEEEAPSPPVSFTKEQPKYQNRGKKAQVVVETEEEDQEEMDDNYIVVENNDIGHGDDSDTTFSSPNFEKRKGSRAAAFPKTNLTTEQKQFNRHSQQIFSPPEKLETAKLKDIPFNPFFEGNLGIEKPILPPFQTSSSRIVDQSTQVATPVSKKTQQKWEETIIPIKSRPISPLQMQEFIQTKACPKPIEFTQKLGQGNFGGVYEGHLETFQTTYAIKAVPKSPISDSSPSSNIILVEAFISLALHHKNLVEGICVGEDNDNYYLVMEFCPGGNLMQVVDSRFALNRPVLIADLLDWTRQILYGLQVLHQNGFVHGDVRPSNIILRTYNEAVLVDYGLVRQTSKFKKLTMIPRYISPETILDRNNGPASDIWSLGVTLATLVARHDVFGTDQSFIQDTLALKKKNLGQARAKVENHFTFSPLTRNDLSNKIVMQSPDELIKLNGMLAILLDLDPTVRMQKVEDLISDAF